MHYERYLQTPKPGKSIFISRQERARKRNRRLLLAIIVVVVAILLKVFVFREEAARAYIIEIKQGAETVQNRFRPFFCSLPPWLRKQLAAALLDSIKQRIGLRRILAGSKDIQLDLGLGAARANECLVAALKVVLEHVGLRQAIHAVSCNRQRIQPSYLQCRQEPRCAG